MCGQTCPIFNRAVFSKKNTTRWTSVTIMNPSTASFFFLFYLRPAGCRARVRRGPRNAFLWHAGLFLRRTPPNCGLSQPRPDREEGGGGGQPAAFFQTVDFFCLPGTGPPRVIKKRPDGKVISTAKWLCLLPVIGGVALASVKVCAPLPKIEHRSPACLSIHLAPVRFRSQEKGTCDPEKKYRIK